MAAGAFTICYMTTLRTREAPGGRVLATMSLRVLRAPECATFFQEMDLTRYTNVCRRAEARGWPPTLRMAVPA